MPYRGRFAPSPTGALHFGSLVAALGSWLRARHQNGVWVIRIEDIDPPREVPGAAEDIVKTLAAFGMESDEPILHQSSRNDAYDEMFERLRRDDRVFPCWCSRGDLQASNGIHRGSCIAAPDPSRSPAWRLRVPNRVIEFDDIVCGRQSQNLFEDVGDFVVKRVEGWHAYQLAVVVDDAFQGITEVVRGADLLDSTARQIYLQQLLDVAQPRYLHLPLALDADGRKLSKEDRSRPVDAKDPISALREALSFLGFPSNASTITQLLRTAIDDFDVARIPKPAVPSPQCAMDTP
jgi:glutamyl-Q tRNA(Asp) synthetase